MKKILLTVLIVCSVLLLTVFVISVQEQRLMPETFNSPKGDVVSSPLPKEAIKTTKDFIYQYRGN